MKTSPIFFAFMCSCLLAQVTTFQRTFPTNNEEFNGAVIETSDGHFMLAGFTETFGSGLQDGYIMKTNAMGIPVWSYSYGDALNQHILALRESGLNAFYFGGFTETPSNGEDVLFGKIDGSGNVAWIHTYGGDGDDRMGEFVRDDAGNFYLIGYSTSSFGAGTEDGLIVKVDSNGNKIWDKTFGLSGIERLRAGVMDTTNALFVTGFSNSFGSQKDVIVMKLDTSGAITWSQRYASNRIDKGQGIVLDGSGNIIVAGQSTMDLFISTSEFNPFLMKINASGNQIWAKIYEDSVQSSAFDLIHGQGSGFVIAGESYVNPGDADTLDCFFMHTDDSGNILWSYFNGGAGDELTPRVLATSDGGYLGTSATTSFVADTMNNIYMMKMDAMGMSGCHSAAHPFNAIDTTFDEFALSLSIGTGAITGSLSWTAAAAGFTPDTLCQSILTGLATTTPSLQPVLFPNPAGNFFSVRGLTGTPEIHLISATGATVMKTIGHDPEIILDVQGLPAGFYLVTISGQAGHYTLRLVIE